jgi:hypothetical protein
MMNQSDFFNVPHPQPELTPGQFRALLTLSEQRILDNFDVQEFATFNTKIKELSIDQRADVRTGIATYRDSTSVALSDPRTVTFINMMGAYGLLDSEERAAQILAGQVPALTA